MLLVFVNYMADYIVKSKLWIGLDQTNLDLLDCIWLGLDGFMLSSSLVNMFVVWISTFAELFCWTELSQKGFMRVVPVVNETCTNVYAA